MAVLTKPKTSRKRATAGRASLKKAGKHNPTKDIAASYNNYKVFNGQQYSGMKVGATHKWFYDKGEWKETKITPDLWRISFSVTKRRAGKAPKGSGAPVGTGYHWYIVAHQIVKKLNANDYTTDLIGLKYKLSHMRATKKSWNIKTPTQRNHLIAFLKEWLSQLENGSVPFDVEYDGKNYKGEAVPIPGTCEGKICHMFDITMNDEHVGIMRLLKHGWKLDQIKDQKLVDAIGNDISSKHK